MGKISLFDTLKVTAQCASHTSCTICCDDQSIPVDGRNLVSKAVTFFTDLTGIQLAVEVDLTKRIPSEAGLGGGSSDAGSLLRWIWEAFAPLNLTFDDLIFASKGIGADIPFFVSPFSLALAEGIGERLRVVECLASLHLVIVKPDLSIPTSWAYNNLSLNLTNQGDTLSRLRLLESARVETLNELMVNDLEVVAGSRYPEIAEIKRLLIESGARNAMMSGSGSAVFGIFDREAGAKKSQEKLITRYPQTFMASLI